MISAKKIIIATLAITVAGGTGAISAQADELWTRNLYDGHNGYYFAYSYFFDGSFSHYSWARLGDDNTGNKWAPGNFTSIAETGSHQSRDWDAGKGF